MGFSLSVTDLRFRMDVLDIPKFLPESIPIPRERRNAEKREARAARPGQCTIRTGFVAAGKDGRPVRFFGASPYQLAPASYQTDL
jgi:hypothetical protein